MGKTLKTKALKPRKYRGKVAATTLAALYGVHPDTIRTRLKCGISLDATVRRREKKETKPEAEKKAQVPDPAQPMLPFAPAPQAAPTPAPQAPAAFAPQAPPAPPSLREAFASLRYALDALEQALLKR